MRVHFIAIGGSAMHNMAIALHKKGFSVSGSDDEINEPSKSRLAENGLLPKQIGWDASLITPDIDAVILGMHAREDNPELIRARELNLKIYSYPEYIYESTKFKTRVVIGGSHGKTTITSMIMYVLRQCGIDFDYMVGAQIEGFDTMVKLTDSAKIAVIEGDEYLASPIDRRPKFHLYRPHIALLSGIAWDHINVFPTFDIYVDQFRKFIDLIEDQGTLIYCAEDKHLQQLADSCQRPIDLIPYGIPDHAIEDGVTSLHYRGSLIPLKVFGNHNLMNLNGAMLVSEKLGVSRDVFLNHIKNFKGASRRLELVNAKDNHAFYKDFAHSPSKLKATLDAVKQQFPERKLIACMELHTFSSLTAEFLREYFGAMDAADEAIVYFNPHTIEHKRLNPITPQEVREAFGREDLKVFTISDDVKHYLQSKSWNGINLLMMSSGNFDGIDFVQLAATLRG